MKRPAKWALRIAGSLVMFVGLAGPAPGHVGGCGGTVAVADPVASCTELESWECTRDHSAGRLTAEEQTACLAAVGPSCSGFQWPNGCAPFQSQVDECVVLLRRGDFLSVPSDELRSRPECRLCM